MARMVRCAAMAATLLLVTAAASAQDRRQNQPGQFDFYVLALSWSPSFCEASAEKGRAPREQCGGRPYSFVVHGLWPQYERGFPEYCQNPAPRLDRNIVSSMLDLMPAPRLIFNEWDKHGVCSGLGPRGYFDAVRKARAQVKIPEPYIELSKSADGDAGRGRGSVRRRQSRPDAQGHRGDLRQPPPARGQDLHVQGSPLPGLRRDRPACVPPGAAGDAADARRVRRQLTVRRAERRRHP